MPAAPALRRQLVVSFHDVHPGSRTVCARFLERAAALGVDRVSVLVVPRWHGGPPVSEDAGCVNWLRALATQGHDLCLHGYLHRAERTGGGPVARWIGRCYTQGEGEFHQLDQATAAERIRAGLDVLRRQAGLPVVGFTAPAWLLSPGSRSALEASGLTYSTRFSGIDVLPTGGWIPAPTLVYSCRNAWRRAVSRAWVRLWSAAQRSAPVLRIAAHPGDFVDPRVEASLYARIAQTLATGRIPSTYRDVAAAALGRHPAGAALAS